MRDLKHLQYFEDLLQVANNALITQARDEGKVCVAYTCENVPEPLLNLPGTFSIRLHAPNTGSMDIATYYMTNLLCEPSRALLERAIEGGFNFADCVITPDGCTMINRAVENMELLNTMGKDKPNFFHSYMEIAFKNTESDVALSVLQCTNHILNPLHEHYGIDISDGAIRKAVEEHNRLCRLIREIGNFRKGDRPRITGYEFHTLCLATYVCPQHLVIDKLEETLEEIRSREPEEKFPFRTRVVLVGSEVDDPSEGNTVQIPYTFKNYDDEEEKVTLEISGSNIVRCVNVDNSYINMYMTTISYDITVNDTQNKYEYVIDEDNSDDDEIVFNVMKDSEDVYRLYIWVEGGYYITSINESSASDNVLSDWRESSFSSISLYIDENNISDVDDVDLRNWIVECTDGYTAKIVCDDDFDFNEVVLDSTIISQINGRKCHYIDCTNNWKSGKKNIINGTRECIDNCINSTLYKYEYNGKCYKNCPNGFIEDESNNIIKCKCELDKCLLCPTIALNNELCTKCNYNYYPMENDPSNKGYYFNCYNELKGYYLDKIDWIYKKCYYSCKTCEIKGDNITHNCLECNTNFTIEKIVNNYTNCYEKCHYYYFFDKENNYYCTSNFSCPNEFSKLLEDKRQCIKIDIKNLIQDLFKFEKKEGSAKNETKEEKSEEEKKEEEIKLYDSIIENIETVFTSDNYDTSTIDSGKDEVIEIDKMTITFTTTENQKNSTNNNLTTIDLGECEISLRKFYNISNEQTLYMKKIDVVQDGMKTAKVEYDVYYKNSDSNLEKLNLSVCENSKVTLSVPIVISENIDKLNSSSDYYNDICYPATSAHKTDITLKDRKKEFVEGNKTVCQEECIFSKYDSFNQMAICSCKVKESSSTFINMKINKTKLYQNFIDIKNIVNIKMMACYKVLFSKIGIKSNCSFFIIIPIIIFHFIFIIIFYTKQKKLIEEMIKNISFGINNYHLIKKVENKIKISKTKKSKNRPKDINIKSGDFTSSINNLKNKKRKSKNINIINKSDNNTTNNKYIALNNTTKYNQFIFNNKNKFPINNNQNPPKKIKKFIKKRQCNNDINNLNNNVKTEILNENENSNRNKNNEEIIKKVKEILEYNNQEINDLSYELALKFDKRSYCQYYISLLRTKNILFFTFYKGNDYNIINIKIYLFFFTFAINYSVCILFYNYKTLHKIYKENGKFNFIYQLPQIIYAAIITGVLSTIVNRLGLCENNILVIKKSLLVEIEKEKQKQLDIILCKLISFFIVTLSTSDFFSSDMITFIASCVIPSS